MIQPTILAKAICAVSAVVALSVLGMVAWAVISGTPSPFFLGFEFVALIAAFFGWSIGTGKYTEGASIGLLCVAGAIGAGGLLGYLGAGRSIGGQSIQFLVFGRAAAAAFFAACAAWLVLAHRPSLTFPSLIRGVVFGALCLGVARGTYALRVPLFTLHPLAVIAILLAASVLCLALLAASVHYSIRAFEMGLFARNAPGRSA